MSSYPLRALDVLPAGLLVYLFVILSAAEESPEQCH